MIYINIFIRQCHPINRVSWWCIQFFRSSYELIVHIWCDENSEVEGYEYEPYVIPYYDTGNKQRYYFPDFLIRFFDNDILFLLEVKNEYAITFAISDNKHEAAKSFANSNNLKYERWSNEEIFALKINYEEFKERYKIITKKCPK